MKRLLIAALAALSMFALAVPASAATYEELEAAVIAAQEEVNFWKGEITRLEGELETAEGELAEATEARDAQQDVVADLEEELDAANSELAAAQATLDGLIAFRATCDALPTNPERNQCKNPTNPAYNAALADVAAKEAVVDDAEEAYDAAVEVLGTLQGVVDDKQDVVDGILEKIEEAESELGAAEKKLADAEAALEAWQPVSEARHNGCNGIEKAQVKTANAKGKAPQVLAGIADSFNCSK